MKNKNNQKTTKVKTNDVEVVVTSKLKKGSRRRPRASVLLETDDIVRDQFGGFIAFIREHAIVGVAIGFVVGQQAQGVIKQLIASFIDPAFQLFFGTKLSTLTFTLRLGDNSANFGWGGMVYILLNLLFVLLTIYIIIKMFKLDKLDTPKPK